MTGLLSGEPKLKQRPRKDPSLFMGITPEDPGLPYKALNVPHPPGPGNPVITGDAFIPSLQVKKLRLREVRLLD